MWNYRRCDKQGARTCGAKVNNEEDLEKIDFRW